MGFSMRPAQKDDCRPEEKRRRTKGQLAVATAHLVLSLGLFVGGGLLLAAGVYSMTHLLGIDPGAVPARSPHCRQPSPHRQPPLAAPHATEPPARPMHLLLVLGAASLVVVALSVPMHSGRPNAPWAYLYQAPASILASATCTYYDSTRGSSEEAWRLLVSLPVPGDPPPRHRRRRRPPRGGLRDPAGGERCEGRERRRLCARLSGPAAAGERAG
eukprot:scaffold34406_cov48-Phaeocystis_antarctica.AAC.1